MGHDVSGDQLALIRIEGMHCHKCEKAIQRTLGALPGVHEVEVDFNSGQASVLFAPASVTIRQLTDAVTQAGYRAASFTQRQVDSAASERPG